MKLEVSRLSLALPRPWALGLGYLDLYLAVRSLTGKMDSSVDPVYMQTTAFAVLPSVRKRKYQF